MYYCSRYIKKKQILDENYFKPRILTKILLESEDGTITFIEMHERTKERYSPHPLKKKKRTTRDYPTRRVKRWGEVEGRCLGS